MKALTNFLEWDTLNEQHDESGFPIRPEVHKAVITVSDTGFKVSITSDPVNKIEPIIKEMIDTNNYLSIALVEITEIDSFDVQWNSDSSSLNVRNGNIVKEYPEAQSNADSMYTTTSTGDDEYVYNK